MSKELTATQRRALRAKAHPLHPVVLIGDNGLTEAVMNEIEVSLRSHELIKVRAQSEREEREAWFREICQRLAAQPVQHIGKTLVLYRERPPEPITESAPRRGRAAPKRPARAAANGLLVRSLNRRRHRARNRSAAPIAPGPGSMRSARLQKHQPDAEQALDEVEAARYTVPSGETVAQNGFHHLLGHDFPPQRLQDWVHSKFADDGQRQHRQRQPEKPVSQSLRTEARQPKDHQVGTAADAEECRVRKEPRHNASRGNAIRQIVEQRGRNHQSHSPQRTDPCGHRQPVHGFGEATHVDVKRRT